MERETMCIQAGYTPGNGESRMIPIIQSTTFKYDTSEDMGKLFDLEASGYFYTRLQNPTNDMVAAKITALEGGTAGMLTSSGQAANFFSVFNIATCGDHVVCASTIYGGTFNLFNVTMRKMGIDFTFIDPDCSDEELENAFKPRSPTPPWSSSISRDLPRQRTPTAFRSSSTTPLRHPSTAVPSSGALISSHIPRPNTWTDMTRP